MAARKKKKSLASKRKGKSCKYGFRKKSAKCLKTPRKRRRSK